jgi:hypothetical protein
LSCARPVSDSLQSLEEFEVSGCVTVPLEPS